MAFKIFPGWKLTGWEPVNKPVEHDVNRGTGCFCDDSTRRAVVRTFHLRSGICSVNEKFVWKLTEKKIRNEEEKC